jgi:hypothetical protein
MVYDGCDTGMIEGESNEFKLSCVQIKQSLIEKSFIYKLRSVDEKMQHIVPLTSYNTFCFAIKKDLF